MPRGGRREGAGRPKGPKQILISTRINAADAKIINKHARKQDLTLSAQVKTILANWAKRRRKQQ